MHGIDVINYINKVCYLDYLIDIMKDLYTKDTKLSLLNFRKGCFLVNYFLAY